jgi:D-threo-aldose 1-dehydrogenase
MTSTEPVTVPRLPFRRLGRPVSRVGLGTYCLVSERGIDHETAINSVRRSVELGVDVLDTAPLYGAGEAEQIVGEALNGIEERPLIISKVGRFEASIVRRREQEAYRSRELIRAQLKHSLRLLRCDSIELMLIHESDADAWWEDLESVRAPVMEELEAQREAGLIGALGLSIRDPERAVTLASTGRFDAMLYVHYYNVVWQEPGDAAVTAAAAQGMGIAIGAPYRRGMLLDGREHALARLRDKRSDDVPPGAIERLGRAQRIADEAGIGIAELGLRFLLSDLRVHTVLVGAENVAQLEENLDWSRRGPLPGDILADIHALREVEFGAWS